jgi:sulfide dehydrogenase cytochrome subunit
MGTLMKPMLGAVLIAVAVALLTPAQAAGPSAPPSGAAMAHTCAGCHGTQGRLGTVEFVPLAGLPEREFMGAMRDFRSGKRAATLMGHVARGFSDDELKAMARYFATVK